MMIAYGIAKVGDTIEHTAGVFGGCGEPRPHADQHAVAWSAVRHVSVAYQPLRHMRSERFSWRRISARHTRSRDSMT